MFRRWIEQLRGACGALVLLLSSCQASSPLVVAHRGASSDAPENTLAAFRLAWEQGADAIEGDFYLSKDGQIVCIHDKDTERVTGKKTKLSVTDATLEELRALEVGAWKDERWRGEKIPTLEEVLDLVPAGKKLFLEVKSGPEAVEPIRQILESTSAGPGRVVIISFDADVIAAAKKALPRHRAQWITGFKQDKKTGAWHPNLAEVLAQLETTGANGLDCNAHEIVDEAFVAALREKGHEFHVWTVNDAKKADRFRALGVDSITTDRPGWLRKHWGEE